MGVIDKAKNKLQQMTGGAKQKVGEHTGDADLQAEGQKDKRVGNLKDAGEKVKDAFEK